jgi:hypothetical protein
MDALLRSACQARACIDPRGRACCDCPFPTPTPCSAGRWCTSGCGTGSASTRRPFEHGAPSQPARPRGRGRGRRSFPPLMRDSECNVGARFCCNSGGCYLFSTSCGGHCTKAGVDCAVSSRCVHCAEAWCGRERDWAYSPLPRPFWLMSRQGPFPVGHWWLSAAPAPTESTGWGLSG